MNTKELIALQQVQKYIGKLIQHKQRCVACDRDISMFGCENLADCYVVLAPDVEGQPETLQPRCDYHAHDKQQIRLTDWQDRVVEERNELHGRIVRLRVFESSDACIQLPFEDRCALANQLKHMNDYLDVLTERIKRFTGGYDIELPSE